MHKNSIIKIPINQVYNKWRIMKLYYVLFILLCVINSSYGMLTKTITDHKLSKHQIINHIKNHSIHFIERVNKKSNNYSNVWRYEEPIVEKFGVTWLKKVYSVKDSDQNYGISYQTFCTPTQLFVWGAMAGITAYNLWKLFIKPTETTSALPLLTSLASIFKVEAPSATSYIPEIFYSNLCCV
jgi:hypothetical protein